VTLASLCAELRNSLTLRARWRPTHAAAVCGGPQDIGSQREPHRQPADAKHLHALGPRQAPLARGRIDGLDVEVEKLAAQPPGQIGQLLGVVALVGLDHGCQCVLPRLGGRSLLLLVTHEARLPP
jgi:hypothetical protein